MDEDRTAGLEVASAAVCERIRASFDRQGLLSHLGARITHIGPGRVHLALPSRPEVSQQHGCVHAGATGAIADTAGGYAALTVFPEGSEVLTVEYKINLLAPALGDHLEAIGVVVRSGRTLTVCQLEVYGVREGDGTRRLVATGQQTLIRLDAAAQ
ncbi:PaaI family thioesterase [Kitasatospora sp. NPDC059795]|uniref:PaaI family thioesterase n=1 Tax=Kitasatospora sp. NPDC059795 TaxID=3346949 RepID=UPI00364D23BD